MHNIFHHRFKSVPKTSPPSEPTVLSEVNCNYSEIRRCLSVKNPLRQTCFLSPWSRCLEQSAFFVKRWSIHMPHSSWESIQDTFQHCLALLRRRIIATSVQHVSMFVRPHTPKSTRPNFTKFSVGLRIIGAVAWSSSDDNGIRYVLPVLCTT